VTRPALSALLNERVHLSAEMALRIEKAFDVSLAMSVARLHCQKSRAAGRSWDPPP